MALMYNNLRIFNIKKSSNWPVSCSLTKYAALSKVKVHVLFPTELFQASWTS
jgi:hypothetical protein